MLGGCEAQEGSEIKKKGIKEAASAWRLALESLLELQSCGHQRRTAEDGDLTPSLGPIRPVTGEEAGMLGALRQRCMKRVEEVAGTFGADVNQSSPSGGGAKSRSPTW